MVTCVASPFFFSRKLHAKHRIRRRRSPAKHQNYLRRSGENLRTALRGTKPNKFAEEQNQETSRRCKKNFPKQKLLQTNFFKISDENFIALNRAIYIYFIRKQDLYYNLVGKTTCLYEPTTSGFYGSRIWTDKKHCDGHVYRCVNAGKRIRLNYGDPKRQLYNGYCRDNWCQGDTSHISATIVRFRVFLEEKGI